MNNTFRYTDDLQADLQSYDNDTDRVNTAIEGLSSVIETSDILTDGGSNPDETSLRLAEHSIECFLKMARIGVPSKIIPSNESFRGKYDISHATLESIGEGIKNVFMSIINAIKSAFNWMVGLIKKLFGRGKDHDETAEKLKTETEEVKEAVKEMSEEEKKASPFPRDADGWISKVELGRPGYLKKIVTSKGIMTREHLHQYISELQHVFKLQPANFSLAEKVKNDQAIDVHYEIPFQPTNSNELKKQVTRNGSAKVYSSHEFGAGEYIFIVDPPKAVGSNDRDRAKGNLAWIKEFHIGKASVGRPPDYEKFSILEGEHVNPDKLLATIVEFNKALRAVTDEFNTMQKKKEHLLVEFEKLVKANGAGLFSSADKKNTRDTMMFYLTYFQKTMDQPAVRYYGECEAIITAFEHLAMHVLAYNRRNGNHVKLKDDQDKAEEAKPEEKKDT